MVRLATYTQERRKNPAPSVQPGLKSERQFKEARFKLVHHLQSSLELDTTIESFYTNIQEFIRVDGIQYRDPLSDTEMMLGDLCKHTAGYHINTDDSDLGSLTFSRRKAFSETELAILEMLIGILFYPLRNALLYRSALESSMRDALTGVGNRAALESHFDREVKLAIRHKRPLALLLVDVDHFKNINDTHGHPTGDAALRHIACCIQSTLRETDQVFRYGGEEFAALLNNTGASDALMIAERIRTTIADSNIPIDKTRLSCTVSVGACALAGRQSPEALLAHADEALYKAKAAGRNQVALWSD